MISCSGSASPCSNSGEENYRLAVGQGRIFIAVFSDKLRGTATVNLRNYVANYVAKNGILRGNYAVKTSYYVVITW